MAGILTKLKNLVKSADLAKTIPQIEAELTAATARLKDLEASRGAAFFDKSDADQAALDAEIDSAGREARNLELALATAKQRREAAETAERVADVESRTKAYPSQVSKAKSFFAAVVDAGTKRRAMLERHAAELAELDKDAAASKAGLLQVSRLVDDLNRDAEAIGRPDLIRDEIPGFVEAETWDAQVAADARQRATLARPTNISILPVAASDAEAA